ncbi:type VII secretion target [Nocardia callitridis]|uniref:Excreted virulence factor EspC (Type VII ESX diderm) n=1 Tax=Nocardia callitridis TaxID=648753 RepID=A0ABP9KQW6_9NOCA
MPERLEIDPDVLRQLALQHEQVARDTRKWAEQPTDWLTSFPGTYGHIADPVHKALLGYYDARERAGNALADEHDRTAHSLRESAAAYEWADDEMASGIRQSGDAFTGNQPQQQPSAPPTGVAGPSDPVSPPPGGGPTGPPSGPISPENDQTVPDATGATPTGPGVSASTPQDEGLGAGAPHGAMPPAGMPNSDNTATNGSTGTTSSQQGQGVGAPPSISSPTGGMIGASGQSGAGDDRTASQPPSGATAQSDATPIPMQTPFNAAVAKATDKEAEPSYVVGAEVNDDLVLAKTLLSGVLAAVESQVGMSWAVSVMRGPGGAGVFITSNEGRGWMPAGLFLPGEVSTPWAWDRLLADVGGSPWEGLSDPARVLAEFGLVWGAKANAQLSALVSSGPIDPGLRGQLGDAAVEGMVAPSDDVDLRGFTPDTADRLALAHPGESTDDFASVPQAQLRSRCVELAADAHAQVVRSVTGPAEAVQARQLRDRILTAVRAGRPVERAVWDELRDVDDLLAATMLSQRIDVGRIGLGDLRADDSPAGLRATVFERRCNELVLMLADESSAQSLRDAHYAHGQIIEHPQFVAAPAAVSAAEAPRVTVPSSAAPSGSVVSAGPPRGAVAAPMSPPPVVAPRDPSSPAGDRTAEE